MVQLAEISWTRAKKLFEQTDVAILPLGSNEQHGHHAPLGTDHLMAIAVSRAVGDKTNVPVLPIIPIGLSEHHRHFPGTLWVPPNIFRDYVKAVALSAATHGVRKLLMINGHGGNNNALIEVAAELRGEHKIFAMHVMAYPPEVTHPSTGTPGHASSAETSALLYYYKNLVKMEDAVDSKQKRELGPYRIDGFNRLGHIDFPWETIDHTDTGVISPGVDVEKIIASEDEGRKMMEPFIDELCQFIEILKKTDVNQLLSKPKPH